jgi:Protein of unknown function (DUF3489)
MNTTNEETATAQGATEKAKAGKKPRVGAKHAHGAPTKAKSAPNPKASKRAPKGAKQTASARDGSKAAKVLDLLKRPEGAGMKDLLKATNWQAHSLRGFLSGTIRKKLGLTVTSAKMEGGERTYSVKA